MAKWKTNRQILRKLVNEADEMTLVFIRERLSQVVRPYLDTPIEELRKEFSETPEGKPTIFAPGFADIYVAAAKQVEAAIDF